MCGLLKILIATPSNTSSVERGNSFYKWFLHQGATILKLEHLDTMFLLAAWKFKAVTGAEWEGGQEKDTVF